MFPVNSFVSKYHHSHAGRHWPLPLWGSDRNCHSAHICTKLICQGAKEARMGKEGKATRFILGSWRRTSSRCQPNTGFVGGGRWILYPFWLWWLSTQWLGPSRECLCPPGAVFWGDILGCKRQWESSTCPRKHSWGAKQLVGMFSLTLPYAATQRKQNCLQKCALSPQPQWFHFPAHHYITKDKRLSSYNPHQGHACYFGQKLANLNYASTGLLHQISSVTNIRPHN